MAGYSKPPGLHRMPLNSEPLDERMKNIKIEELIPKLDEATYKRGLELGKEISKFLLMTPEEAEKPAKVFLEEFNCYTREPFGIGDFDDWVDLGLIVQEAFLPNAKEYPSYSEEEYIFMIKAMLSEETNYVQFSWFNAALAAHCAYFENREWLKENCEKTASEIYADATSKNGKIS